MIIRIFNKIQKDTSKFQNEFQECKKKIAKWTNKGNMDY